LIEGIQEAFGLSVLFISHDLSVVRELCDRVAVMYLGEIVEVGPTEALFSDPQHPYTAALLSAIPTPDRRIDRREIELTGTVPDPSNPPSGCRFHTRCHEVVQPDGADLEQPVWRRVLTFRERVEAGEVDPGSIRQSVRTREQVAEGDADVPLEARVRAEFDLPGTLPDPTAERELAAAIEACSTTTSMRRRNGSQRRFRRRASGSRPGSRTMATGTARRVSATGRTCRRSREGSRRSEPVDTWHRAAGGPRYASSGRSVSGPSARTSTASGSPRSADSGHPQWATAKSVSGFASASRETPSAAAS